MKGSCSLRRPLRRSTVLSDSDPARDSWFAFTWRLMRSRMYIAVRAGVAPGSGVASNASLAPPAPFASAPVASAPIGSAPVASTACGCSADVLATTPSMPFRPPALSSGCAEMTTARAPRLSRTTPPRGSRPQPGEAALRRAGTATPAAPLSDMVWIADAMLPIFINLPPRLPLALPVYSPRGAALYTSHACSHASRPRRAFPAVS
mmetsp:Transcript_29179/g.72855  ORF Transcript_29179/g.72855 Transcript_29179/m.72855 type:complete len:206 (+) Transcript_29179:2034-2651(+)